MTQTIWKFNLNIVEEQTLMLPSTAKILHVGLQFDQPQLWVLLDSEEPKQPRKIFVHGTGQMLWTAPGPHIGTFLAFDGSLVWHVFEEAR